MTAGSEWLRLEIGDIVNGMPTPAEPAPLPSPGIEGGDWYAAYAAPGCEFEVAAEIKALGLVSYAPKRIDIIRRPPKHRPVKMTRPALSRYVFFESFASPRCWAAVRDIRAVVGIVTNGMAPVRIRREAIGDIMAAEDMGMFDSTRDPSTCEIIPGDPVSIIGGAFQGYEATVKSVAERTARLTVVGRDGERDVKVRLDLLKILA